MKKEILKCDIVDGLHGGNVSSYTLDVVFDHDQNDGRSKQAPYFSKEKLEMCDECRKYMFEKRRLVYGYGAMGYNKYYLTK